MLHREKVAEPARDEAVHLHDVGMRQACHDLGLAGDAGGLPVQHLERHGSSQLGVACGVYGAHAARAQHALHDVATHVGPRRQGFTVDMPRPDPSVGVEQCRQHPAAGRAVVDVRLDPGARFGVEAPLDHRKQPGFGQAAAHDALG